MKRAAQTTTSDDRDIKDGLLPDVIETLLIPDDAVSDNARDVTINDADVQCIGSYNWLEESTSSAPAILVPGSPPEWQNKSTPYKVPADEGLMFADQNGFRMPKTTLLPLMAAVDVVTDSPPFDWSSADFITDRNGLRKLLRWIACAHSPTDKNQKEFRIDTQLAGHTTKRYQEKASGFTYRLSTLRRRAPLHCRCWDFAGLKMVVRFEVDACLPTTSDIDTLTDAISNISLSPSSSSVTRITGLGNPLQTLTVKRGGFLVPQSAILELSSVSYKRADTYEWAESLPQLYMSNTPQHFLGVHDRGRFLRYAKLRTVNLDKGALMQNLAILGQGRLTLVRDGPEVRVYARESDEACLPEAYMKKFEID
ncbi:hypothetical protein BDZ89DRAFT_1074911 [Hymenopellis radicata]|nr:hypothetical protein BDZ89DRAFT_1074911 [Hymenopellis radicata]